MDESFSRQTEHCRFIVSDSQQHSVVQHFAETDLTLSNINFFMQD